MNTDTKDFVSSRNACKACAPLGAALVFKGIAGAVPLLHGSQGCATYMRRFLISHFREPVDIASSNFSESSAVFGGKDNLKTALDNIITQYAPRLIGVATTCLAETIGDNLPLILQEYAAERAGRDMPLIIPVATPSYAGTHMEGFHAAVRAVTAGLARQGGAPAGLNVFPGMLSPADLRYLREILADFGIRHAILPDYADTLDGGAWDGYQRLPEGGTPLDDLTAMGDAAASLEFGSVIETDDTAAAYLAGQYGVPRHLLAMPVGMRQSDALFTFLASLSGRPVPEHHRRERGRLVDAYVDGHKYLFGKKAVVYGEEDLVVAVASFLAEIGVVPVLCVSGGESGHLRAALAKAVPGITPETVVKEGADFMDTAALAGPLSPDFIIGNSRGGPLARSLGVPLVRIGFPVHDRFGAQRLLHIGYRGTQALFDRIVNMIIARTQRALPPGYMYL